MDEPKDTGILPDVQPPYIPPTPTENPDSIVGGTPTLAYPDCCAIGDDGGFYCTGTLIAPDVVVTARHCSNPTRVFLDGSDVTQLDAGKVVAVKQSIVHDRADVDLQVLVLAEDAGTAPRHVAQGAEIGRPDVATVVGFGTVDLNGQVGFGLKREVEVPIVTLDGSEPGAGSRYGVTPGIEMVAGQRGLNRDTCCGDSGGPLYVKSPEGATYLLGVTLRGSRDAAHTCGDGGIYLRVDQFLDWICEQTGVNIEGPLL